MVILRLLNNTGARASELCGLQLSDPAVQDADLRGRLDGRGKGMKALLRKHLGP